MRVKVLTKILAAFVAASTVAITPGFASAMLPESKAYIQSVKGKKLSSDEFTEVINRLREISKEDDEAKKEVAGAIYSMESNDSLKSFSREQFLQLIATLNECASSKDARPNVAFIIHSMLRYDQFFSYSWLKAELLRLTDVLIQCFYHSSGYCVGDAMSSIEILAKKGLLNSYSPAELLKLTDAALSTLSTPYSCNHISHCSDLIVTTAKEGLLNSYSHAELLKLTDALVAVPTTIYQSTCQTIDDKPDVEIVVEEGSLIAKPLLMPMAIRLESVPIATIPQTTYGAIAIETMAKKGLLNSYSPAELLKLTDALVLTSSYHIPDVVNAIETMTKKGLLDSYSPAELLKLKDALLQVVISDDSLNEYTAKAICVLAEKDLLKECSNEKLLKLTDILIKCANCANRGEAQPYFVEAIGVFAEKGFLKQYSNEKLLKLKDAVLSIPSYTDARAAKGIDKMARAGLLDSWSNAELLKLTGGLWESSPNSVIYAYAPEVPKAIGSMAEKGLLNSYSHTELQKLTDKLIERANNNKRSVFYMYPEHIILEYGYTKNAVKAIGVFVEKDLLRGYPNEKIPQLIYELTRWARSNETSESFKSIISNNYCGVSLPQSFLDELKEYVCVDEAKSDVAKIIVDLAKKDLLSGHSIDEILDITDALIKCAAAKSDVEKVILDITKKALLNELAIDKILDITDKLIKCAAAQSDCLSFKEPISELVDKLASCVYSPSLSSPYFNLADAWRRVSETILDLSRKGLLNGLSNDKISKIPDILVKSAAEPSARPKVLEAILNLAEKGLLTGLSNDKISKLTDILIKSAAEPSARLKVLETIADLSRKDLLNELSNDKILKIVDALKLCVSDNGARHYVAISISRLASNSLLGSFESDPEKLVDLLDECSANHDCVPHVLNAIEVFLGRNNMMKYYDQTTDEGRRSVVDELVGGSLLKNLTDDGKEKLKDIIDRCVYYI